ncbi:MAG: type IV secretory system conjugative DNA transfer family protein [Rhodospirillales bacterium]|nr:type IV secretory system conjugative DNA transfer family protein [Rhodospirillales bacterium]
MRTVELSTCALLLAAGGGWAIWLTTGYRPVDLAVAGLVLAVAASLVTYFATDRKRSGGWIRFGIYSAGLSVSTASCWTGMVRPLGDVQWRAVPDWLKGLDEAGLVMLVAPIPAVVVLTLLWCEAALHVLKQAGEGERRRRAKSDLHGRAALLDRRSMRRLARRRGILLGQWGARRNAPLIGWSLEGSAITVAPPRVGKGALIALNLLSPEGRGFDGSTVTIDPRGELWCIASRRRRDMGRRAVLVDPFGVVKKHKEDFGECYLPDVASVTYNPLSFIRDDEGLAVRDINVLLDALLTPPRQGALENSRHFYESARAIIAGYMAWVRFREPRDCRTLGMVYRMLSMGSGEREEFAELVWGTERFAGGLAHIAVERQTQVGKEEGGSNFSTIANQLAFLNYPELLANTSETSFYPTTLACGDTDLFVVVPEETVEHVKGWLRLWVAIPNAVASITPLKRDMLIVIDEMPRLGYLKPVMDGYTMAAGKGVHFWCFAQSISALDSTWGKEHRKTLLDLAEVVQILGFPRTDAEGAEEMSKAIGTATFEGRTESRSGTVADGRVVAANTQWQAGESFSLVRERLVTPDELMTLGPVRQYVIGAAKDIKRDALHLHHAHYWKRPDTRFLADPNPLVLRKERAAGNTAAGRRA